MRVHRISCIVGRGIHRRRDERQRDMEEEEEEEENKEKEDKQTTKSTYVRQKKTKVLPRLLDLI